MSRTQVRRGHSIRGRTTTTSTVTVGAEGGRKTGDSTKVQSRSGSAKPVERGSSAGPTQSRKSEENAPNGHNRVLSKTRNEIAPMHDSSNNSTPQSTPPSPIKGKGQYTNRFGRVVPIIVDLEQTPIPTNISSNVALADSHTREQPLKADIGDMLETTMDAAMTDTTITAPRKDQPQVNEVCRQYLRFQCRWGHRCRRLHPERPAMLRITTRPKMDEICRNFTNGYCNWGEHCDRIHPPPNHAKPSGSTTSSEPNLIPEVAKEIENVAAVVEGGAENAAGASNADAQISIPADMNCNSDAAEAMSVEQTPVASHTDMPNAETEGSPTHESRHPPKTRETCRNYLVHLCHNGRGCSRWHPPAAEIPRLLAEEEARPKSAENCIGFLRGRCRWGAICTFTHSRPGGTKLDESIVTNPAQLIAVEASRSVSTNALETADSKTSSSTNNSLPKGANPEDSIISSESNTKHIPPVATEIEDVLTTVGRSADNAAGIIDAKSKPIKVNHNDVPAEGKCVEQPVAASLSNMPKPETQDLPALPLKNLLKDEICRCYLIGRCEWGSRCHRFHPPERVRLRLLAAEKSRPKMSEVCPQFLMGRCFWGGLCNFTHAQPQCTKPQSTVSSKLKSAQNITASEETSSVCPTETNAGLESSSAMTLAKLFHALGKSESPNSDKGLRLHSPTISPASVVAAPKSIVKEVQGTDQQSNTSDTPQADGVGSTSNTKSEGTKPTKRKVCKRYLDGIDHNTHCRRLHPPLNQQASSANQQVPPGNPEHPPNLTASLEVDAEKLAGDDGESSVSDTSNTPLVKMPQTDRFSKKTGRLKTKKNSVPKMSSASTPASAMTNGNAAQVVSDGPLIDVPIFPAAPPGLEVVKLPSPQRSFSVSIESGYRHNGATEQTGGTNGGSGDSQTPPSNLAFSAESFAGISTSYSHTNGGTVTRKAPSYPGICIDWVRGRCYRGRDCRYLHTNYANNHHYHQDDKPSESDPTIAKAGMSPQVPLKQDKNCPPQRDPSESVLVPSSPPGLSRTVPLREPPPYMTVTVLEHTKINLGAGFEVREVTTGFESRWVILGNIPSAVTEKKVRQVLKPFGQVDDLRMPASNSTSSMNIKVLFSSSTEAIQAAAALNGALLFSRRISARLPINNTTRGNGTLQDCSVRIEWDIPGRLGYAGYPNREEAEVAVSAANGLILRDSCVAAGIYEGLPTLGAVNVRFVGLPPTATAEDLEQFGTPETVMLERPNYMSLGNAVRSIQTLLNEIGEVLSFEVPPPPHRDGIVRGWAHFTSPSVAQTASAHLNGRRPYFIGKGKIFARHVQALSYTLPMDVYDKLASDIAWLRRSFWDQGRGAVLSVVDRRVQRQQDSTMPVFIKLSGEDVGPLGQLKAEFEKLLHGEKLMEDGKVVWDGFLERPVGSAFLHEVERVNPGVSIQKSIGRRTITLFGPISKRRTVRRAILDKIARIRAQQTWVIPLAGRVIGLFMSAELMELQRHIGHENVVLHLLHRILVVRGNNAAYEAAQRAVHQVQKRHPEDRKENMVECPVCFNQVVSPINLQCGHIWCKSCLSNYLVAATDNKIFPLRCLGGEATCSHPIPVSVARDILSADDFDAVVNASFLAYVYARPDEFHYCPTPDCDQIYRSAPPDTVLQCPSCLTRICPSCHVEAHDGLTCANRDVEGDKLFKEWTEAHDVKSCPGCKALIERTEGCNHMTCARCQTHICWVCMETFPHGEGIYDHMRKAHGGIGL